MFRSNPAANDIGKTGPPGKFDTTAIAFKRICHRCATNLTSQFPIWVSIAHGRGVVDVGGQDLLESESPVAGGIGVPVGERGEPALEPWALDDVTGERRGRHFESRVSQLTWVW